LGRFLQPDSSIPDPYNPLDFDRYAYVNYNPVNRTDPSGHWPTWPVPPVPTLNFVPWLSGDASNFGQLMAIGIVHRQHANIVCEGLQSLQDDPSVKDAQGKAVDFITNNSDYRKKAYSYKDDISTGQFTANGPSRNFKQAAKEGNPAFWMVHTGELSATNTKVSADGTITTTCHIHDKFDFIPGPEHNQFYNFCATIIHPIYNGLLGAKESYPTDAYWNEIIPPKDK
jgi:hypothetical protein